MRIQRAIGPAALLALTACGTPNAGGDGAAETEGDTVASGDQGEDAGDETADGSSEDEAGDESSDSDIPIVELPENHYQVGEFVVVVRGGLDEQDGGLSVYHLDEQDRMIWETAAGEGYLTLGVASPEFVDTRGTFEVEENVGATCGNERISGIEVPEERLSLVLTGLAGGNQACAGEYSIRFDSPTSRNLRFVVESEAGAVDFVELTYESRAAERFYGFGEQYSHLDHKGMEVPILTQEQGIGRGHPVISPLINLFAPGAGGDEYTTYYAAGQYVSTDARAFALENTEYSVFDLRQNDEVSVRLFHGTMTGRIFYGADMLENIESVSGLVGRMPAPPAWFHSGAIVGIQGGTDFALEVWDELEARDTPVAAFWLQDWVGQRTTIAGEQLWWNWELDETHYPMWDGLVATLESGGARTMGYINPFLVDVSGEPGHQRNLYQEALDMGYLVEDLEGETVMIENTDFSAALVDLSNEEARTWLKAVIIDQMLDEGLSGWMADFGEALPFEVDLASGEDPEGWHNRYPEEWAKLNREALVEAGVEDDVVFFTRSGFTHSPQHTTMMWLGDQTITWDHHDGFISSIRGLLSGGFSGITLNHSDAGGYASVSFLGLGFSREENLLERWIEANAFTAVLRTHEGNQPGENAQIYDDAGTYDHFARFAKVYAALAPYRSTLFEEAADFGRPVVRHPILYYSDPYFADMPDTGLQYMLGDVFMVAPVLEKNTDQRDVYLPEGEWVHLWTGDVIVSGGASFDVDAPVGEPPVYYVADAPEGQALRQALIDEGLATP